MGFAIAGRRDWRWNSIMPAATGAGGTTGFGAGGFGSAAPAARRVTVGPAVDTLRFLNIANADTPGYQALDVSFNDTLREASSAAMPSAGALTTTARGHIAAGPQATTSTIAFARYVEPEQPRLDGNTVDMDRERGEFSKNAILYRFAVMTLDDESKEFKQAASDPRMAPR